MYHAGLQSVINIQERNLHILKFSDGFTAT